MESWIYTNILEIGSPMCKYRQACWIFTLGNDTQN